MPSQNIVLDKIKTLVVINVLEPVKLSDLSKALKDTISKEPHSKLWGIRGKGATPQDYGRGRFHPASKLTGIQRKFL